MSFFSRSLASCVLSFSLSLMSQCTCASCCVHSEPPSLFPHSCLPLFYPSLLLCSLSSLFLFPEFLIFEVCVSSNNIVLASAKQAVVGAGFRTWLEQPSYLHPSILIHLKKYLTDSQILCSTAGSACKESVCNPA